MRSRWTLVLAAALVAAAGAATPARVPLRLADALERALRANGALAVRRLDPAIARAQVRVERGAFDRTLTLDVQRQMSQTPTSSSLQGAQVNESDVRTANVGIRARTTEGADVAVKLQNRRDETNSRFATLNPAYTSNLVLSMTQPLSKGGGSRAATAGLRAARRQEMSSQEKLRGEASATVADVERAYLDLLFARRDVGAKEFALHGAVELVRYHEQRRAIGMSSRVQVVEADSTAQIRREELLLARRAVWEAQDVLARLMAWPSRDGEAELVPDEGELARHAAAGPPGALEGLLTLALRRRPDYLAALHDLAARDIRVRFALNQERPRVDLVASYQLNGLGESLGRALSDVFEKDLSSWTLGFTVEVPIDNLAARGERERRVLDKEQALLNLKAIEDQAVQEVTRAHRRVHTDGERLGVARRAYALAVEKLAAEEARFKEGMIANFDLLRFQEDLATARSRLYRAQVDRGKSIVDLDVAAGVVLERRGIRFEANGRLDAAGPRRNGGASGLGSSRRM